jgi:hypothetical protein
MAALFDGEDLNHFFVQVKPDRCIVPCDLSSSVQVVNSHLHYGTSMPIMSGGVRPIVSGGKPRL